MRWKKFLAPIHYDEDLFEDLITRMEEYSSVNNFKARVGWDQKESEVTFDDPRDVVETTSIPNRILSFSLMMQAEEGRIEIAADGHGGREFHRLIINGDDEEWVKSNLQNISEFEKAQKNRLRSLIRNSRLRKLQYVLLGSILTIVVPYAVIDLHPMFRYPIPQDMILIAGFQVVLLGLLEIPKKIYPYVILTRLGSEPLHRVFISILIPLLSFLSLGFTVIQFIW